ncbi:Uncharacterised protein [Kingella potus]|uniref:Uncharacterized protein n=1 Tax=Kingella potus TaxID=265175 RepID=A0A377QZ91_9NEIS|nr:hypothetical protein [Kingella potus]UOP01799.1 hypothetical protein LVJ84_06795 [Kingella potus]STQ99888.1 Uncharacterised protein [Kingella potus]
MNHRTFTMMAILVSFAASLIFGTLYIAGYLDGGGFFLCMAATLPALLLFRSAYNFFFCKNQK